MSITADWETILPLDGSSLHVSLQGNAHGIDRMRVQAGSAIGSHPGARLPWDDVLAALAAWPLDAASRRDWTRHPAFPRHGTAFQRAVWGALCAIGPGETVGYGELARRIGRPGAARAIGQAVGANPWAPLVPCHRVLAGDGSMGGYAGGTELKAALLALEGRGPRAS